jgi:tetratricopeptide (TPR) repeat protein
MVVEGTVAPAALSRLLLDLQEITGLSFVTNADAQPFLIGRTVKIQSKAVSLAVLMDVVFRPLNLFWEQTGTEIHLRPVSSLAPAELAVVRAQQAIRLTRQIVINFPNHDCRNSLRVSAANFELLNGQYDAAATAYNQLLQEQQAGEINAALQLNLGLLEKKLHRLESAVELYFRAVDQSADNALKAIAYANIAQINIELGHTEPAIQAAARSLTLTSNGTVRVAAALDLARAYLINRDPLSANRVLFENATFFEALPQRKLSSVLAAYGRSLGTLSPVAKSKAVETLLIALADITPSELNFSVDKILVAKAYASIGLPDRAIDILSREPGPDENVVWRRRRLFELAQMLNQTGARDLAASQFRLVAENLGDVIGMWSQLELARIQLLVKKDPQSCLDLCRKLWLLDLPETIKSNTLNLMGQAYREIGDLDSSVFCFYGMLPHAHSLTAQSVSEDEQ